MTTQESLEQHQRVCDELYELALEENRFLRQHRHAPSGDLIERKRSLQGRLASALDALRASSGGGKTQLHATVEKARSRILQILQLDRENEQLLLRYSLGGRSEIDFAPAVPAGMLEKIYGWARP
jgi:hypothetical protein